MTKLVVDVDRREYVTREVDPEDCWDNGDTAASIRVSGVQISKRHFDINTTFDVSVGDVVYVVWVDYDTGCTFGRACNQFELVDIFNNRAEAEDLQTKIETDDKGFSYEKGGNEMLYTNNGESKRLYTGTWKGYFDSFNSASVAGFLVT